MNTILLATDGSEPSERALAFAIDLARGTGATLEIVSVRSARLPRRSASNSLVLDLDERDERDSPERIAGAAAEKARSCGVDANAHAARGDVVACIADTARTVGAELLVVGSRGLGSVSGAMLGSVSQALVRRSSVPVTVVRQISSPARA
jgi:nucleotide-binding universal stress UspA family protein